MSRSASTIFTTVCLLFLIGFARDARAIPIANDIDLDWQNGRFFAADDFVTVVGMPRLFTAADDPDGLLFDILVTNFNNGDTDELFAIDLEVLVVNSNGDQYTDASGDVIRFTRHVDETDLLGNWLTIDTSTNTASGVYGLVDFLHSDLLPTTGDWIYLLSGSFIGHPNVNQPGGNQIDENGNPIKVTYTGDMRITIEGRNAGTLYGAQPVPEPATLSLLVVGFGMASLGLRRRRRA